MSFALLKEKEHIIYLRLKRMRILNSTPSVISSNCNGAVMLHDLKMKFNTPTVNLYILPGDFLKFVTNLKEYLSCELIEVKDELPFPVGELNDIKVYFQHYTSFDEAHAKWVERSKRVDYNNLFIIMTQRDGCTYEQMLEFDALPYTNKVIFTYKPYKELKSAYYIKGFENMNECGVLSYWNENRFLKRRHLDEFDSVRFFNGRGF